MELFMDVNDTELFEESIRKEREEMELRKKKKGEKVGLFRYIDEEYWWLTSWYIDIYFGIVNTLA